MTKNSSLVRSLLLISALFASSHSFAQLPPTASAQAVCTPLRNPALRNSAVVMCDGQLLNAFASLANQTFKLPRALTIVGAECGQPNAYYAREKNAIFICYELIEDINRRMARESRLPANARVEISSGAMFFIFAHELGHALVDQLKLPVLGREEDAADQIATFLLLGLASQKPTVAQYWTLGAHWFFAIRPVFFSTGHFADEHSLGPQRQFNIVCWIYGSNPHRYSGLAQYAKLPRTRGERCQGEYQQMMHAAKQMLGPHAIDPRNSGQTAQHNGALASDCQSRANDQNMAGAYRFAFIEQCNRDNGTPSTERNRPATSMAQRAAECQQQANAQNYAGAYRFAFIEQCYKDNGIVVRSSQ